MSLKNTWHHRRVAESAAKACWICYKPSNNVLITPDQKDFFYICAGHLKDRHFCTPDADEAAAATKRKEDEEMRLEIEKVKEEYALKMRKKMEKRDAKKAKEKGEEKKADKEAEKEEDKNDEKERDAKLEALAKKDEAKVDDGPRIYSLHKNFYQQRLDRIRNAELAKRNRERLKDPSAFPSVPSGNP